MTHSLTNTKRALVLGAGGFIGSHLVKKLKSEGYWVRGVDLKYPEFSKTEADEFIIGDLRNLSVVDNAITHPQMFNEVYQLAADMGGAGYIFTGRNDYSIMHNSAQINLNVSNMLIGRGIENIFYSSSACMYPAYNQLDPDNPKCHEDSAYPANPDSEYGWEKLFSERLYLSAKRNHAVNTHIARFHNIFGPEGTWCGGKEKAPAALCHKVAKAKDNTSIEVWGTGKQTRSFLYIDECIEGILKLTRSNFCGPVNIGSTEMLSINDFAKLIIDISGKKLNIRNIHGPVGVNGRNSDNTLIEEKLNWKPSMLLRTGLEKTYQWIQDQVNQKK